MRIALNAFRTSPKTRLCVEANEPPLHIRRLKLSLKYACKLHTNPQNPLHEIVFNPTCIEAFRAKPNSIPSFGVRILPILRQAGVLTETIATRSMPVTPPWQLSIPTVNTQLHSKPKTHTPDTEYITEFNLLREEYHDYYMMYTDGSKCAEKASAAVVTALNTSSTRLPNSASIFSAECKALLMALNYVKIGTHDKVVIFTDSLSVLQSLEGMKLDNPLILKIIEQHHHIRSTGKNIVFCWVPSHVNIKGNELADRAAKSALSNDPSPLLLPCSDFYPNIDNFIREAWQQEWNTEVDNKLHSVQAFVGKTQPKLTLVRDDMVIRRVRIGHTRFTHKHHMEKTPPPMCQTCQQRITVRHIFIECKDLKPTRDAFFKESTMKDIFDKINQQTIIDFLKEIDLYDKI